MPPPKDPEKYALWLQRQKDSHRGHKPTEEARTKMRAFQKARNTSPDARAAQSVRQLAVWARKTPEERKEFGEKVSAGWAKSTKKVWSEERRACKSLEIKAWWATMSPEERSEYIKSYMSKSENRLSLSKAQKRRFSDPEQLRWLLERLNNIRKPTSIELAVYAVLDELGIPYEPEKEIGMYHVDISLLEKPVVIEVDGEYWHSKLGASKMDAKRDRFLQKKGYTVIRLLEKAIREDAKKCTIEALKVLGIVSGASCE